MRRVIAYFRQVEDSGIWGRIQRKNIWAQSSLESHPVSSFNASYVSLFVCSAYRSSNADARPAVHASVTDHPSSAITRTPPPFIFSSALVTYDIFVILLRR